LGLGLSLLEAVFGFAGSTVQLFGDALHPPEELGGTDEQGAMKQEGERTVDDVQLQPPVPRRDTRHNHNPLRDRLLHREDG
jgi:hypothetical protein